MSLPITELLSFLSEHLQTSLYSDVSLNGLQVEGRREVQRLALGVSASERLFEAAAQWNADAVLVHHGLFWGAPQRVAGPLARRLRLLLSKEISLLAYHIPLDAHPEDGNNAVIARALGLEAIEPWGSYRGREVGAIGTLPGAPGVEGLKVELEAVLGDQLVFLGARPDRISKVAVCSGSGGSMVEQAIGSGVHLLVTGEPGEPAQELAREGEMTVVGAGHYNTERFGVQALGQRLGAVFGLETSFIDVPNPI